MFSQQPRSDSTQKGRESSENNIIRPSSEDDIRDQAAYRKPRDCRYREIRQDRQCFGYSELEHSTDLRDKPRQKG